MATQVKVIGSLGEDVVFEIEYDDVSFLVTRLRCLNTSAFPIFGQVERITHTGPVYQTTFAANQTTEIPVSSGANQRLQLSVGTGGKLDGVEYHFAPVQ